MTGTFVRTTRRVVARSGEHGLVTAGEIGPQLIREEEIALLIAHDGARAHRRYGGRVSGLTATVARLRHSPHRLDLGLAIALTIAGTLEVLLGDRDGSRLVSALALPLLTLPLALRGRHALAVAAAMTAVLVAQAVADGFLVGHVVVPIVSLVIALYSVGRHVDDGGRGLAGAAAVVAGLVATRIAFDPAVEGWTEAVPTLVYVPLPLLVGRWVRGQVALRRELEAKIEQLDRERERGARQAAEDERVRITGDLQALVADGLAGIIERARTLPPLLRSGGDHAVAPATFASIAATARDVLDDVRRVLGILRREGDAPQLAPPVAPGEGAPAARPDLRSSVAPARDDGARRTRYRRRPLALGRAGPRLLDRLLVACLFAGAEVELAVQAAADQHALAACTAALITAPLLWRRHRPVVVFAAVLGAVAVQSAVLGLDSFPAFDIATLVCATYAIGAHADRRLALAGLALAAVGAVAHAAAFYPTGIVPALIGGVTLPWVVGRIVRGHRHLMAEATEKAARDEHARAQEAHAAMTAERMRVARELHDAVAHNISVIAIQAAGAEPLVARDPERAAQCAELIEQVGGEALVELGRMLEPAPAGRLAAAPHPSLAAVDALAERARDSGLRVELRVEGEPVALPVGVDLAAYRIVQEALTNSSKHAGRAHASVVVRYEERAVEVEIGDDGRGPARRPADDDGGRGGGGHGLAGMRERVALYGGTLDVGRRPGGGFRVHARLPIAPPSAERRAMTTTASEPEPR
jgi:signal transduction histidine kinase